MPERFLFLDGTGPFRKLFAPNWYLVFYLVEGDTVFVEYIIDGRQNYRWLLSFGNRHGRPLLCRYFVPSGGRNTFRPR